MPHYRRLNCGPGGDRDVPLLRRLPRHIRTDDGLEHVFAVNVLAPYLLTGLIERPGRLVYLNSGMHRGGDPGLADPQWEHRRWNGSRASADSKLFDVVLAFAVARLGGGIGFSVVVS